MTFRGSILFAKTDYGYKVIRTIPYKAGINVITGVYPYLRCICIDGFFNFQPIRGQFCKRPHRLIAWK